MIAGKSYKEVSLELNGKESFAIGFENKSGGFELRSQAFKGSASPKDVTLIESKILKTIVVLEGFFGFVFYQTLHQKSPLTNFLVLNFLAFFDKSRKLIKKHKEINLHLD